MWQGTIGKNSSILIDDVHLAKGLTFNLLCASQMCDKGNKVAFTSYKCDVVNSDIGNFTLTRPKVGHTYVSCLDNVKSKNLVYLKVHHDEGWLWNQ